MQKAQPVSCPVLAVRALASAFIGLLVLLSACRTPAPKEPFYIFKDGKPAAAIILPAGALKAPPERFSLGFIHIPGDVPTDLARAVEEFRRDLREGYGVELPLGENSGLANRIEIVVEEKPLMQEDETTVSFPKANVMRIAGGESGVMRTLFYILEEFGGVRYLFPSSKEYARLGTHFPELSSLSIPRQTFSRKSAFPLDRISGPTCYGADWPGERNRLYWWGWDVRLGIKERLAVGHHLTKIAFPIEDYIRSKTKPDDDMFPILRGERVRPWEWAVDLNDPYYFSRAYRSGWQPRFSSPKSVDEAARNILAYLRKYPTVTTLSLAVNDCGGHCETEKDNLVEAYYRWVNAVAERVTAEFPKVMFGLFAYREVQPAPKFKLHSNVVAYLTMDFNACIDPKVKADRERLIREWAEVAKIDSYSYDYGEGFYTLPRLYFREMQAMLQYYHEHGAVAALSERCYSTASEGPKMYVYCKLLENPHLDMEAVIQDWCRAAVGAAAAPSLRQYYAFWEDYWRTKAVKTKWWNSRTGVYLGLGHLGSYMYGLEKGDMARCRALMEKTVALADTHGTADQKARARFLMKNFEWNEAGAAACGAGIFAPDGSLPDAAAALALLRAIPVATKAYATVCTLPKETKGWIASTTVAREMNNPVPGFLAAAGAYITAPEVLAELGKVAENQALDSRLRALASAMHKSAAGGDAAGNLLANGSFEQEAGAIGSGKHKDYSMRGTEGWETWDPVAHGKVSRTNGIAAHGSYALKWALADGGGHIIRIVPGARPNVQYYFSARVFIPSNQPVAEGRLNIMGNPVRRRGDKFGSLGGTANVPDIVLTPGQWTYVSCIIPGAAGTEALRLRIDLKRFERGDVAYVDDVQVLELPDRAE